MSIKKLFYKNQYMHLKVLQLRYCGRDSIIQVRIDLIFIMVPLGEQKQMEESQTYKTSCRYVAYSKFGKLCLIQLSGCIVQIHPPQEIISKAGKTRDNSRQKRKQS